MAYSNFSNQLPDKFHTVIKLKFLFTIIKIILLLCIYFTYDENLFAGLSLINVRNDDKYMQARATFIPGITFFAVFTLADLFIQLLGFTYKFHKINIINLSLHIFSVYLLLYFILDAWHYVTIWYIFVITQFPQTLMELYAFLYALFYEWLVYNKIRNNTIKPIKSN